LKGGLKRFGLESFQGEEANLPPSSTVSTRNSASSCRSSTITLGTFTVGADGKFSYSIGSFSMPPAVACDTQQLFADVTVTATDAQQDIAHDTFNASNFCNNTSSLPGSFGGGCP
jgi:VCBS repeat-containing protein